VLSFSNAGEQELVDIVRALRGLGVQSDVVPRLFELVSPRVAVRLLDRFAAGRAKPRRRVAAAD